MDGIIPQNKSYPKQNQKKLEQKQKIYNKYLKDCQKQMQQHIKTRDKDLKSIQDLASFIVSTTTNEEFNDEMRKIIEIELVDEQVTENVKQIKKQWEQYLNDVLNSLQFTANLHETYQNILKQFPNPTAEKILLELKMLSKVKVSSAETSNIYQATNIFMITLSQIFTNLITNTFVQQDYQQNYKSQQDEIILTLNQMIINKYKSKYENDWKNIQTELKQQELYTELYIVESYQVKYPQNQLQLINEKNIKDIYGEFFLAKFQMKGEIFPLIFDESLQRSLQVSQTELKKSFLQNKSNFMKNLNAKFDQKMEEIKDFIFDVPFQTLDREQIKNIPFLILERAQIRNEQEKELLTQIMLYLNTIKHIDGSLKDVLTDLINVSKNNFQQYKKSHNIRDKSDSLINYLHCIKKKYNFYLFLLQLYMIVSNIHCVQKQLEILPYYGYNFSLKCNIVECLVQELQVEELPHFFNYLDRFFEEKIIESNKINNCKVKIINPQMQMKENQPQQPNEIMSLLRITNQEMPIDYFQLLKHQFFKKCQSIKKVVGEVPKEFYLVKVSDENVKSRNVIIAVSGFTSEDEDKQIKWKDLGVLYPNSEIFALQYKSETFGGLINSIRELIINCCYPGSYFKLLMLIYYIKTNPFEEAMKEAEKCGKYLAHLIHNEEILPNSTISFVGFSLGTKVIEECLQEYKKLIDKTNRQSMIGSVILMGGVADIDNIQKNNLIEVVSHKLINCFSKNDGILTYLFKATSYFVKAAGLNPIVYDNYESQKKVLNFDFSSQINGHEVFMLRHADVLQQIDFRQEYINYK